MELKKLSELGVLDRVRVEDASKYTDAQLQLMLRAVVVLTGIDPTIKKLRSKELYLLATNVAKYPLTSLPALPRLQGPGPQQAGTTSLASPQEDDGWDGMTRQDIIELMRRADIAFKSPPPPLVPDDDGWEDEDEEEEDYFKPVGKKAKARAAPLMDLHKPKCFRPSADLRGNWQGDPRKLEKEFYEQLKGQEAGINRMTVGEYLENRARYEDIGRSGTGAAQERARNRLSKQIRASIVRSLNKDGIIGQKADILAEEKTKEIMSTLAALHEPDMGIGGQDPSRDPAAKPLRMGNRNVNSSIGAQWARKGRLGQMDAAAEQAFEQYGTDAKMNVILERCKP